ncbi:MAG: aromatic amino acid ammonia-lyase, partial [Minwuiales bacterium]|nr:aromatic amino acid ammonia-lyase [Minwuiales bacterium]
MTVQLESRRDITLEAVDRTAWQKEDVRIADNAMRRMADCKASFLRLLDDPDIVIYGVTSGYGQHARLR